MKINGQIFHQSRHLNEEQLQEPMLRCPFCGGRERHHVYLLQRQPDVELCACRHCHAATASRMPTAAALDEYYTHYYVAPEQSQNVERVTFDNAHRFGVHLASTMARHIQANEISILDFGGGDGSIAYWSAVELLSRCDIDRISIVVVDYNDQLMQPDDDRIDITRADELEAVTDAFDIVIASAIIEHLPEPLARRWYRGFRSLFLERFDT